MVFVSAVLLAGAYLGFLFWIAARQDRAHLAGKDKHSASGWVYGLSLAVYCTSWTFFGGVGTAATAGLEFLPIFLGPILVFTFGHGLIRRILAHAKAQHSTSIADILSARYGKSGTVAALVTVIATLGALPYMALQLQSVGNSLMALDTGLATALALDELVLIVTVVMALFAILFGSRRADHPGENAGLVFTIALESIVKLVALAAIAALALIVWSNSDVGAVQNPFDRSQIDARFWVLTLISACAVLCLPRQFHMTFVEARGDSFGGARRWVFPAYLALIAAIIVPIAMVGPAALPAGTNPDTIVLELPLATGNPWLAILAFIGGLSASIGMIVVASVALSTMITNDLVAPVAFRSVLRGDGERGQLARQLLAIRRIVIASLLVLAYLFYLGFGSAASLARLGTLAFAASAQFAPGLVFGVLGRSGNRQGMIAGLLAGFASWILLLIVPTAFAVEPLLAVHADAFVSGVILSLAINVAVYWAGSLLARPSLVDAAQAAAFAGVPGAAAVAVQATSKRVADIRLLLSQFVGKARADAAIAAAPNLYRDTDPADLQLIDMTERIVAGVVGTSSARMLVTSWAQGDQVPFAEVVAMFDETSRRLSFSADLLQIAIENIDQGVALVDSGMNLVAWNSRYQEMFNLPDDMVVVGTPIAQLIRYNLAESGLPTAEIEQQVARRLEHMREGRRHSMERTQADGRIMRILGNAAPGGGYVTSYTDVTADRRAEQALEDKVRERTAQLSDANEALRKATQSKTRFLAAASHDLIQPLNAARLFASALGEEVAGEAPLEKLVRDLDGSIASADQLIRTLLDISKLDGGGIQPKLAPVTVSQMLEEVRREFAVQAEATGVELRCVETSAWVTTDRALLLSILRNLTSNALRYTETGAVLLGVKRRGDDIAICVADTGPGIDDADQTRIFDEFQRASTHREGLGLGLAIVQRIARLLDAPVSLSSEPGRGSVFALTLPVTHWGEAESSASGAKVTPSGLGNARVLIVDNDEAALAAGSALLGKWGLKVTRATSAEDALAKMPNPPDIVIVDFRLDDDERGDEAYRTLCAAWDDEPPVIMVTAEAGDETARAAAGVDARRLLKPTPPAALRALLADAIARSAAGRADQFGEMSAEG
ncbi:PAS domain-containing hybrid sensor histidine kinase/response regulator [Aurantiacibacter gangjinensis]|uniref:histidine kinase n=1 Tax=Aurantiacibacter gangjinensis TaxID=502682 RepID=A0A0G9MR07_9SPHN|nr:PAS domain-containing hybrid sensor histidine kinase/response regulator [Aurantiacibacter gangjinensis]APE29032.1 putative two-component sensor [Aurantiacibacter gangjinensis]KLE33130.1 two-component system sensor protein [Aurantiacibacter gangjinensis]